MVTGDARVRRVARIDETTSLREPLQGQFYLGSEVVPPGEWRSGWAVFEVPSDAAIEGSAIGVALGEEQGGPHRIRWESAEGRASRTVP
jgi:hypothetical protein